MYYSATDDTLGIQSSIARVFTERQQQSIFYEYKFKNKISVIGSNIETVNI